MGVFRDLSKLIPNSGVRSVARKIGNAADRGIAHGAYEADRAAFFSDAEQTGNRITSAEFPVLPATLAELAASPYNDLRTPINTAALFVVALGAYSHNREEAITMINYLRGPCPMSADDIRLLDEFFAQNNEAGHFANSYLAGATPQNGYTPSQPYLVFITDNPYTYIEKEYAHLLVACSGAEAPRSVTLRKAGDGLWYLWQHALLEPIYPPM